MLIKESPTNQSTYIDFNNKDGLEYDELAAV